MSLTLRTDRAHSLEASLAVKSRANRRSSWRNLASEILNVGSYRIPDDWIDNKRYPLFMAREVMRALIEQLQP